MEKKFYPCDHDYQDFEDDIVGEKETKDLSPYPYIPQPYPVYPQSPWFVPQEVPYPYIGVTSDKIVFWQTTDNTSHPDNVLPYYDGNNVVPRN